MDPLVVWFWPSGRMFADPCAAVIDLLKATDHRERQGGVLLPSAGKAAVAVGGWLHRRSFNSTVNSLYTLTKY